MNEFSGKSSSQIVSELDSRRNQLRDDIEALNHQFQPDQLWETARATFASSNSNELLRNLGRSVRDNPLPLALVGAGIAWMIVDQGRKHHPHESSGASYDAPSASTSERMPGHVVYSPATPHEREDDEDGANVRDRISGAGTRVRESITSAKDGTRDRLTSARDTARDRLSTAGDATRRRLADARSSSQQTMNAVSDRVGETYRANPLVFGLGAAAAAAVLGALLPKTRREEEVLGDYADQAREAAEAAFEKATDVAAKAGETIREETEKRGYTADAAEATVDKAVDDARDIARKSLETVEDETKSSADSDDKASDGGAKKTPKS